MSWPPPLLPPAPSQPLVLSNILLLPPSSSSLSSFNLSSRTASAVDGWQGCGARARGVCRGVEACERASMRACVCVPPLPLTHLRIMWVAGLGTIFGLGAARAMCHQVGGAHSKAGASSDRGHQRPVPRPPHATAATARARRRAGVPRHRVGAAVA